jgi:hypothetical protein
VRLAVWNTTLATATCLFFRLRSSKFCVDLIEVFTACIGGTLFRHLPVNRNEFEHLLSSHRPSSAFGSDRLNSSTLPE